MTEEINAASTPSEEAPPAGQAQPESGMTSEQTSSESTDVTATPEAPKQEAGTEKVNLFKSEEFRKWQQTQTAQIRAAQAKAQELKQKLSEQQKAGMNDYERAEFEKNEAIKRATELEQQMEIQRLQAAKQADMERLNEKTGIPLEQLAAATSYEEAQEMAMDYLSMSLEEKAQAKAEAITKAKSANRTDTGGGQPVQVLNDHEQRLSTAKETRNARDYYAALLSE